MKKSTFIALFTTAILLIGFHQTGWGQIPFTQGNIAVLRVGDGAAALSNASTAVFIDEYNTSGTLVQSIAIPTSGVNKLTNGGTASSEGLITLSPDGQYLTLAGYDIAPGTAAINSTTSTVANRKLLQVNNAVTYVPILSATAFSAGNPRGGVTTGTDYWASGSNSGVQYFGSGTPATVSSTVTNIRGINIYNGQLYFSTGSGTVGIWAVGTGLPTTTGQTSTNVINTLSGTSPSPYAFAFNTTTDICYIADDRTSANGGGIQKWTNSGSIWSLSYTLSVGTTGARGLTIDWSGANPVIYATTTTTSGNKMVKITDTGSGSVFTDLATAGTNTAFRGIAFAPSSSNPTLTVSQTALTGFTYVVGNGPSAEQTFTVAGTNLTNDISISAATDFEVSLTSGSGYTTPLTLTQSGGTVSNTTIYTRMKADLGIGSYGPEPINITSTDATPKTVACTGTVTSPGPSITVGTLAPFGNQNMYTTSAQQNYAVSGANLTGNIVITPPDGFQISTIAGLGFTAMNPITLEPTSGLVNTTIYVRFAPTLPQTSYSGNITHTSPGATQQDVAVSGTGIPPIDVASIADLRAGLANNTTVYRLTSEAIVTFARGAACCYNQLFLQDATAAIVTFDLSGFAGSSVGGYSIGDGVTGLIGTLQLYYGLLEFIPLMDPGAPSSTGNTVTPLERTLPISPTDESKLILIKRVSFTSPTGNYAGGTTYPITDPSGSGFFRTNFGEADYIGTAIPTTMQNMIALVGKFNADMQITPRFAADIIPFTPTWISGWPKAENATSTDFIAKAKIDVPGSAYFVVLLDGAAAPSAQQVKDGQDASGTGVADNLKGTIVCEANIENFAIVTGLTGSITYNVYFVAEAYANLQSSPVMCTVTTTVGGSAPVVLSPTATSIASNSAELGGTIASDGGNAISERGTVWSLSSPVTIADNKLPEGGTSIGAFSHTRTSLPVATQIFYAAYATNAVGTTLSESNFYTLENEPTNHVPSFTAGTTTTTTIQLNWTDATGDVIPTAYILKGSSVSLAAITDPVDGIPEASAGLVKNVNQGVETVTFTGLSAGIPYYFKIYPYTGSTATINYKTSSPVPEITVSTLSANTYDWIGADNGVWTVSTNWNPERATPLANDILQFNTGTNDTITGVPTEIIGQLILSNNTTVNLKSSAAAVLTIAGLVTGTDLVVPAGSALNLKGTGAITIALSSGATGSIDGNIKFTSTVATTHKLTATSAGAITFNSGAIFTAGLFLSGNAFGGTGTTANSVIFASGSTYIHQAGSNPFALTAPASVVVFQTGSLFKLISSSTPAFSGRTYANFELDATGAVVTPTGGAKVTMDNLTVTNGTLNFNMTGTPGHSIKGNITVAPGATLNFSPLSLGSTVNLNGLSAQTISGNGTITGSINSILAINNSAGVTLNANATLNGALTLTSGLLTLGTGNLTFGVTGALTGTPSVTNMIIATGAGELRKTFTAAGSYTFPVGDNTGTAEYSPVTLNFTTGTFASAWAGVNLVNAAYAGSTGNYLNRYWNVISSGITDYTCDAQFNYDLADVTGDESSIYCVLVSPQTYYAVANTTLHQLTASGATSLGTFTGREQSVTDKTLNLTLFLEGLYAGGGMMNQAYDETGPHFGAGIADQITVVLYDGIGLVYTASNVDLNTNGTASLTIPAALGDIYYIGIKHRNSIQTASALPISFAGGTISYDFTTAASQAYGSNQTNLGLSGVYGFYAGDENQDGLVESGDMIDVDNAVAAFGAGYIVTDINGDGLMDSSDMIIIDNNNAAFVGAALPY